MGPEHVVALISAGKRDEAIALARRWTEAEPQSADSWRHLGVALAHANDLEGAEAAIDRGLQISPDDPLVLAEKAFVCYHGGRPNEAARYYAMARERGDHPVYGNGLGSTLMQMGRMIEARQVLEETLAAHPTFIPAHFNLVQARLQSGDQAGARAIADQMIATAPREYLVRDAAVWPLLYDDQTHPDELAELHQSMGQLLPKQRDPRSFPNNRNPDRRLRVGFVSPDFREHSVYRFVWPVLEALADYDVDLYAYASSANEDFGTRHIASLVKKYTEVTSLSVDEFARQVSGDKIDVLFDLAGHTLLNRLVDMAHRLAPVQINWIGYPYSTGVPAMDYRIVDSFTDPDGSWMSEAKVWLQPCFLCFGLPRDLPPVADATDGPTFGSFNVLAKMSPTTVELYSRCLAAVPGSKLILKAQALDEPASRKHLLAQFAAQGVTADRIELYGRLESYQAHLELYNRVTVALDPFPYHGTTTTCEAYSMGVPVVSLVGETHQARVGLSLAHAIGRPEWACFDPDSYVNQAVKLASLNSTGDREVLRARLSESALTDADSMAERLMEAVRAAWQRWCALR
ncbi:MAG: tetratricopeptide repeat protein [Armatimonadetes bacterium]|nr:tetratricopeptide repeat protein [Armatimonadota bacterium]